jgi:hypothetical protein
MNANDDLLCGEWQNSPTGRWRKCRSTSGDEVTQMASAVMTNTTNTTPVGTKVVDKAPGIENPGTLSKDRRKIVDQTARRIVDLALGGQDS